MPGANHKGRRKGVAIREGSVAQARKEAGLTLAQVADGKVSRTAIHLIEKGFARPTMETLRQIARQTRKPLGFFVQAQERRSTFSEQGRLQTARRYLADALAAGEATREPSIQAKVHMLLGQVDEWCGNTRRADEQFETAIRILQDLGTSEQLRDAHMAYAEVLSGRPMISTAAKHWRLAAEIGKFVALGLELSASPAENAEAAGDQTA